MLRETVLEIHKQMNFKDECAYVVLVLACVRLQILH